MDSTHQLTLTVPGPNLGEFISSLLGQRRTIEKEFRFSHVLVPYEWILNTIEIVNQRVSQNKSELGGWY
jgi:hypothetical protein